MSPPGEKGSVMPVLKRVVAAATMAAALLSAAPASAVTFNLIDTGGAARGTQARIGFDIAALYWGSVLRDPITINLQIGFRPLRPGVLGSTGSSTGALLTQSAYAALMADRNGALDTRAVANLTPLTNYGGYEALDVITNGYVDPATRTGVDTNVRIFDADGSANNAVLDVNTANLKALGLTFDDNGNDISNVVDGGITFSSNFGFDFDPTDGIAPDNFDFIAVAIHEIGHALGFVSGVDIYDLVGRDNGPLADPFENGDFGTADIGDFRVASMLDLFRYSEDGLDWSVGTETFFSIDGGQSELFGNARFSTGAFNGDGSQASHWIDNIYARPVTAGCDNPVTSAIGIMNPTIGSCEAGFISGLDLAAFDAMGYDLDINTLRSRDYVYTTARAYRTFIAQAVPEAATWMQMIFGFGLIGGLARRRRAMAPTLV